MIVPVYNKALVLIHHADTQSQPAKSQINWKRNIFVVGLPYFSFCVGSGVMSVYFYWVIEIGNGNITCIL